MRAEADAAAAQAWAAEKVQLARSHEEAVEQKVAAAERRGERLEAELALAASGAEAAAAAVAAHAELSEVAGRDRAGRLKAEVSSLCSFFRSFHKRRRKERKKERKKEKRALRALPHHYSTACCGPQDERTNNPYYSEAQPRLEKGGYNV